MEIELLLLLSLSDDDGVSSVVSSSASSTDVSLVGEDVYEFPFALVSPLGTENDGHSRVG